MSVTRRTTPARLIGAACLLLLAVSMQGSVLRARVQE